MADLYWVGGAGVWIGTDVSHWSLDPTSSRSYPGNAGRQPNSNDNVFFDQYSGSGAITGSGGMNCYNLDTTGFTGYFTGNGRLINVYGTSIKWYGGAWGGSSGLSFGINFVGVSPATLEVNNSVVGQTNYLRITRINSTSSLTLVSNITSAVQHYQGTFDANGYSIFNGSYATSAGGAKIFKMGSGTWNVYGWDASADSANLTLDKGTANIVALNSAGSDVGYNFGGKTYNKFTMTGSMPYYSFYIWGGGTFSEISRVRTGAPSYILFDATTATTVGKLTIIGTNDHYQYPLTNTINSTQTTSISMNGYPVSPRDGSLALSAPGSIKIGTEVISYTSYTQSGITITFTGVTRGANGTEKSSHTANDTVYVPAYLGIGSTDVTRATLNLTTPNGTLYAGINSVVGGNTTGTTIVYTSANGNMDYMYFSTINFNITPDPTVSARFFAFR